MVESLAFASSEAFGVGLGDAETADVLTVVAAEVAVVFAGGTVVAGATVVGMAVVAGAAVVGTAVVAGAGAVADTVSGGAASTVTAAGTLAIR